MTSLRLLLSALCLISLAACGGTVATTVSQHQGTALYGNVVTQKGKPYVAVTRDGYVLNDAMRMEYNGLIDIYGHGTEQFPIAPPLGKDAGLIARPDGTWLQDGQHQTFYRDMLDWRANGIAPRSILQKILK